jgi:hypothetical protein
MSTDRHSRQAARIVRGLGDLPGSKEVNIVARKFPRVLASEPGTCFHQEEQSFPLEPYPQEVPIPTGMDDIFITVRGELPDGAGIDGVLDCARSLLSTADAQWEWDVRSVVKIEGECRRAYQVMLFTDAPAATPAAQPYS